MSRSLKNRTILIFILLAIIIIIIGLRPKVKEITGNTMGTSYHISYISNGFQHSESSLKDAVDHLLEMINDKMSTYRSDSELMKLNKAPLNKTFYASSDLFYLIQRSIIYSDLSDGAYDVTVGPLVNIWGFGPSLEQASNNATFQIKNFNRQSITKPADSKIQNILANKIGYKYIKLDEKSLGIIKEKDVFIDLSSIAKGFGLDEVAQLLKSESIKNFMIEIGGEVLAQGKKKNKPWRVGISGPEPDINHQQPGMILELYNKGIATSGNYLNFFEQDGIKYSHIINPKTGYPEKSDIVEVSVISKNVADADATATMLILLGKDKGLEIANKYGIIAHFIYTNNNRFDSVSSESFIDLKNKQASNPK